MKIEEIRKITDVTTVPECGAAPGDETDKPPC
jgi:hypothetical protein